MHEENDEKQMERRKREKIKDTRRKNWRKERRYIGQLSQHYETSSD
jgi:hypothetical protein